MNPSTQAVAGSRVEFEWGRIQSEVDWLLPLLAMTAAVAYVVFMYRRESRELHPVVPPLLGGLRVAAMGVLLWIYLQPQFRTVKEIVRDSRVLLLVDTSLSMAPPSEPDRSREVVAALAQGKLIDQLRARHDVVIGKFDQEFSRVVTLPRLAESAVSPAPLPHLEPPAEEVKTPLDLNATLVPGGSETRLAQAIRQWIGEERGGPVSCMIVISDGQQNAGVEPAVAIAAARESGIPVFTIGVGSDAQPVNLRVSDLVAPVRAYPGDRFSVIGYLQAQGLEGRTVFVELSSRPADGAAVGDDSNWQVEETQEVTLGADGEVSPVRFQLTPSEVGRRTLRLLAKPVGRDSPDDNRQEADVEIIDQNSRLLLFAGGPSREYQFLRNQLRRDKDVVVDVLLQTGGEGMSQDAEKVLRAFPSSLEALSEYDGLVAFDPDWRALDARQQEFLERWVAEQAGGLVLVAGPIHTPELAQDPALARVRGLYPVEFQRRFAILDDVHYGSREPWPIEFSREGLESDFLWLDETQVASGEVWSRFEGVHSYFEVRGPKQAATVYGTYSDPRAAVSGQPPVYFASQFYGAGRVFYMGSGEMWRIRSLGDEYFERFYTKVIRHVSQGRLLRGSPRGVMLVDRYRYPVGAMIDVRAQLRGPRLEPLDLPSVPLSVVLPDRGVETVILEADPSREGAYRGQFTARSEGVYRLELVVPESDDERLTTSPIQVLAPNLEREDIRRNDALLAEFAERTGGRYFVGLEAAVEGESAARTTLAEQLRDKSVTLPLSATPEPLWDKAWVMYTLCGLLCLEWLIRRLNRLA